VLDQSMAEEIKMAGEKMPDALTLLMADPATQVLIAEKMKGLMEG
jgi:hypothetical protein